MLAKLVNLQSQRRDALFNAALKEFSTQGYDHASTNMIAKEAGISKALMFHYVKSKQELFLFVLFLFVYDYFNKLLDREYYCKINYSEKDILTRLHRSYLLQIELLKQYPWIFDFHKLSVMTASDEVNNELKNRACPKQSCQIFDMIDVSTFRDGLNIKKCQQFILWANIGFTNQILDNIRNSPNQEADYDFIIATLDDYFDELRKVFYKSVNE